MYILPQEIEVWYIIPAIRKEFAKVLVKKYKLSYEKAGNLLGISKAAVSQYLSNKRANKIKLNENIKNEIAKSAKIIISSPNLTVTKIEEILRMMKEKKCSCNVCKKFNKDILKYCNCKPIY